MRIEKPSNVSRLENSHILVDLLAVCCKFALENKNTLKKTATNIILKSILT